MDKGAFIMHRCHGISTDINTDATRAVTKMKATITQRFVIQECEVDAESDCRFCFFWIKVDGKGGPEWRARFVRHWYEKVWQSPVRSCMVSAKEIPYRKEASTDLNGRINSFP